MQRLVVALLLAASSSGCCTRVIWERSELKRPADLGVKSVSVQSCEGDDLLVVVEHSDGQVRATRWKAEPGTAEPDWSWDPTSACGEPRHTVRVSEGPGQWVEDFARERPEALIVGDRSLAIVARGRYRELALGFPVHDRLRITLRVLRAILLTPATLALDVVLAPFQAVIFVGMAMHPF